eukprot:SAG11_NODE_34625_length_271_cov_0.488372_1_plen_48_part_10
MKLQPRPLGHRLDQRHWNPSVSWVGGWHDGRLVYSQNSDRWRGQLRGG